MSLRINQNISAMQGHYYMQMNEATFNKQIERLSSGLRINRAADDPAGLVISEKYRAQVDGLAQAINNAKDGIGMVQTAEGALDEATKLLRTMRNLALHAANLGPNDSSAIQADQDQITSEIESMNRIAERTKFGSKTLLDGSLGLDGAATDSNVAFVSGSSNTKAGTYTIDNVTAATQGVAKSQILKYASQTEAGGADPATTGGTIVIASTDSAVTSTLTIAAGSTLADIAAQITSDTTLAAAGFSATESGGNITLSSSKTGTDWTINVTGADVQTVMGATFGAGGNVAIDDVAVNGTTAGTVKFGSAENLFIKDTATGNVAQVSISTDDTVSAALTKVQNALTAKSINVTASFDATTGQIVITNGQYGDTSTIEMMHSGANTTANLGMTATAAYADLADGLANFGQGVNGADVAGDINGQAATGSGTTLTLNLTGDDADGLSVSVTGTATGDRGQITISNNNLTFQVGAFAGQTVSTQIDSVKANALGTGTGTGTASVAAIDVTTATGAQDAIMVLDEAISDLSSMRGKLGSFQKDVLESTVNNLGVAKTNLSSSESLIRDADMAQEMLTFSKAQILQQTGMAMLAQANSAPQQIMSLFKG
ncbi:MAG: flagellin [Candidatus Xenobiia bacterium LiM19]